MGEGLRAWVDVEEERIRSFDIGSLPFLRQARQAQSAARTPPVLLEYRYQQRGTTLGSE